MSDLTATVLAIAAVVAALATIVRYAVIPLHRMAKRIGHFLDDWFGEEARPGRKAIPAIPERIAHLEKSQRDSHHSMSVQNEKFTEWIEESIADRQNIHETLNVLASLIEGYHPPETTEEMTDRD